MLNVLSCALCILSISNVLKLCIPQAWFCLDRDSFPRKQCIAIVSNVWFERVVLILIAINCVTMTVRVAIVLAGDSVVWTQLTDFLLCTHAVVRQPNRFDNPGE